MIISLRAVHDRAGECKVLIMDHDNVIWTLCTFLIDQLSTTTIVWGHVITRPLDMVHDATSQECGNSYAIFY